MDNVTSNLQKIGRAACRVSASRHAKVRIVNFGRNFADASRKNASNARYRNVHAEIKTKSLQNLAYTSSEDIAPDSPHVYNHVASNFDKRVCKIKNYNCKIVHVKFQVETPDSAV